jgi:hypothetical protein
MQTLDTYWVLYLIPVYTSYLDTLLIPYCIGAAFAWVRATFHLKR